MLHKSFDNKINQHLQSQKITQKSLINPNNKQSYQHLINNDKKIKYKQFMQQLQNSSRSSNYDQQNGLSSQRSVKSNKSITSIVTALNDQKNKNKNQMQNQIINQKSNQKNIMNKTMNTMMNMKNCQKKLYTFQDIKDKQNNFIKSNNNDITNNQQQKYKDKQISKDQNVKQTEAKRPKYFKKSTTNKMNQIKNNQQSHSALNQIQTITMINSLSNSQQINIQKTKNQNKSLNNKLTIIENKKQNTHIKENNSSKKVLIPRLLNNKFNSTSKKINQSQIYSSIKSLKSSPNKDKQNIKNASNIAQSVQNSNHNSNSKDQQIKEPNIKQKQKIILSVDKSSKKKIISLNINHLKASQINNNNYNKVKMKLSLDRYDSNNKLDNSKNYEAKNYSENQRLKDINQNFNKNILTANNSLQKNLPSFDQSKIDSLNNSPSKKILLSSKNTQWAQFLFKDNNNQLHTKQSKQKQIQRLYITINEQQQKQKKLKLQIQQLQEKITRLKNNQDNHREKQKQSSNSNQLEILKKDCQLLHNSYKQIKKLYQSVLSHKEQLQLKFQQIYQQNYDLKQCLKYKKNQINQLDIKLKQQKNYREILQRQLEIQTQKNAQIPQISSLTQMIKTKLNQYQNQVNILTSENEKLHLIRQKLQKYNETLKQQIQEKDMLISKLQQRQKNINSMNKSIKKQIYDYKVTENSRLNRIIKQLQGKLKLTQIHTQYLTKQLLHYKGQFDKKQRELQRNKFSEISSSTISPSLIHSKSKYCSNSQIAKTITTRNSSICNYGIKQYEFHSRVTQQLMD